MSFLQSLSCPSTGFSGPLLRLNLQCAFLRPRLPGPAQMMQSVKWARASEPSTQPWCGERTKCVCFFLSPKGCGRGVSRVPVSLPSAGLQHSAATVRSWDAGFLRSPQHHWQSRRSLQL